MRSTIVGLLLLLALGLPLLPQSGSDSLDFHASFRTRLEMWNWFEADGNGSYPYLGNHYQFTLGQKRDKIDWTINFAVPFLLGLPDDAAAPPPQGGLGLGNNYYTANQRSRNAIMVFPKQAFVKLHHLGPSESHSVQLGRFNFSDGSETTPKNATLDILKRTRIQQRLIGSFGWSHVGRSYNGFQYAYESDAGTITAAGAIPSRGVFQVDGWGVAKAAFGYASFAKAFDNGASAGDFRVFGIYYHDWRPLGKTDNRDSAVRGADRGNIRIGTFGAHYVHAAQTAAGAVDVLAWGVIQTGRWSTLDHHAGAMAFEAGFQPVILPALKPWIRGGLFQSTGDDDPNDGDHESFFQILPTPRIYSRTPFYNLMNLQDYFGELVLRPHKLLTIRSDVHALRLAQSADLWYAGGGVFNPWIFGYAGRPSLGGRGLATLYDISADVKATAHLTLSGYYAYANGKSVMANIYPDGKNLHFGYLELTYGF